jgi:3-deoxy-D-manno-octulosonate 8-phosphate phosphatase (KDO 8-P phosphatase)
MPSSDLAARLAGVLTDGTITVSGERRWSVTDGFGFLLARRGGLKTALCSGRNDPEIEARAERLRIDALRLGRMDKGAGVAELAAELGVTTAEALFVGDDLFDLPGLDAAGVAAVPADARPELRRRADWVLSAPGGRGAAREVIEAVLRARGDWERVLAEFTGGGDD